MTSDETLRPMVREILNEEFLPEIKGQLDTYLKDISFRIDQAYDVIARAGGEGGRGSVHAEELNLPGRAFLTGYVIANNSPAAGSIAWTDLHIVYAGTDYVITNGNTNLKYAWWSPTTTPTVLQVSNTKPTLAQGDVLVLMNNSGTHRVMLSETNTSLPGVVSDGAIDSSAILANAVTALQLADGSVGSTQLGTNAVTANKLADGSVMRAGQLADSVISTGKLAANAVDGTKLADGAVTRAGQLADSVVGTTKLAANAVDGTKLADGAVTRTGQLAANVVTSGKVADGAINRQAILGANTVAAAAVADGAVNRAGQLADSIVSTTKIAANAVDATRLADGAVVRPTQLSANVVTTTQLANNAVTNTNIAGGAVNASKLNTLQHLLY